MMSKMMTAPFPGSRSPCTSTSVARVDAEIFWKWLPKTQLFAAASHIPIDPRRSSDRCGKCSWN